MKAGAWKGRTQTIGVPRACRRPPVSFSRTPRQKASAARTGRLARLKKGSSARPTHRGRVLSTVLLLLLLLLLLPVPWHVLLLSLSQPRHSELARTHPFRPNKFDRVAQRAGACPEAGPPGSCFIAPMHLRRSPAARSAACVTIRIGVRVCASVGVSGGAGCVRASDRIAGSLQAQQPTGSGKTSRRGWGEGGGKSGWWAEG